MSAWSGWKTRLDGLDQHLTRIDGRFDGLERRIDRILIAMIAQTDAILGAAVAIADCCSPPAKEENK